MDLTDMPVVLAVRHADIDLPRVSDDPPLNAAGRRRARALARLAGPAGVTAILTSEFTRTKQTVDPLAHQLGVPRQVAESPSILAGRIRAGELGDVVVVAGHSDTIPEIITVLGAAAPPPIAEAAFDNLYVVTVAGDVVQLLHMRYSAP
jgi:broad specificity phosphatase PhoE